MDRNLGEHAFLDNGGAMGERIRAHDWSGHLLGPVSGWVPALRTGLAIVLGSAFPTFLAWGEGLTLFFNDAYLPMLGNKADTALGRPHPEVWHEVWPELAPYIRRVLDGESFFFENYAVTLERHGYPEQAWFTFSYSPLRDETGAVRGVICTVMEVTDKVQALARHKQAEERLALSLEASGNIGTWSYDLETGATHVDERFARLFQVEAALAREGTELNRFTDMIHPEDRPRVLAAIDAAIRNETLYDIEYRIPQRSGVDVWVNARGKVFADPAGTAGNARRFAGIAVDISERKAQAEALRASEARAEADRQRLDVLLEAAPVGIFYVDRAGKLLSANAANNAIWGAYPQSQAVEEYGLWKGWHIDGPLAGQALAAHEWPVARVLAGRESDAGVFEIEPFDIPGLRRTVLVRAAVLRDAGGAITGAVAAHMDITPQVAAEKALKESEGRFRAIANVIPQMVWSTHVATGVTYLNERWQAFTGVPTAELANGAWYDAVHPDDQPELDRRWEHSRTAGLPFEFEHRLRHHSGQYRWVLSRALPFADAHGKLTDWMGTLTDIHAQKTGEAELRAQARRKDEFLAMLAHELRNPLAPISNAAQLLGMPGLDERRLRQSSEIIARQVRHMTELVDDLLDVSRVTRGLVQLDRTLVDVGAVVAGAVEQARPLVEARGHTLELHLDAGGWVDGDRTRLVQVVSNLLNNAAKYTPQGGRIALQVARSAGQVTISVRDNGIGIGPDVLPQVFDLFTQAERTPDRTQGGLGLGLALVKSLVQLHGGSVRAESAGLGQGSRFSVSLALARQDDAAPAQAQSALADVATAAGRARILIVDDNLDAAQSLGEVLRAFGHAVASAASSREALDLAAHDWPQVFVLDIGLPDIDGYELVRRLRTLQDGRPALYLALTGYGQAHDRVLSRSAGFDHHFVKPVDLRALVAVIDGIGAAP